MTGSPAVVVVGSINTDMAVPVSRHPRPGETVLGGDVVQGHGGKGANQAVAVARLGSSTAFVGRVGDDGRGAALRDGLAEDRVGTDALFVSVGVPSGVALIAVADDGENTIVVSPGANTRLVPEDIRGAASLITYAAVVLVQLEIPEDAVVAAVSSATGTVVLNPAPARALPDEVLDHVDVLVPNRLELAVLVGAQVPETIDEATALARQLPVDAVVVTLGAQGALLVTASESHHIPPSPVDVVDSTGAGDAFCGALAHGLASGWDLKQAVRWAAAAGALATTAPGARTAPSADEVARLLEASR